MFPAAVMPGASPKSAEFSLFASVNFPVLMRVLSVRLGTISTEFAGSRKLWCSFAVSDACAVPPVGRWKTFVEGVVDIIKGSYGRSTVEVAPLSLPPEGMVPSSTIARISFLVRGLYEPLCSLMGCC